MSEQEPRYRQVLDELARRIRDGYYPQNEQGKRRLPSQQELRDEFAVGNTTLRMALAILEDRGVILSEQGKTGFLIVKPGESHDRGTSNG